MIKTCKICKEKFEVGQYRSETALYCSRLCKGKDSSERMKGNKYALGGVAWNKGTKGICKPNQTSFKKGNKVWNKNKKGIHLSPKTEFKKGRISDTKQPLRTIVYRPKCGRNWIKVSMPNLWMLNARFVYLLHYSDLDPKKVIHHKDGNQINDTIQNLIQLTRKEHINLHRNEKNQTSKEE
jgi:hypothetical protein